MMHSVDTDGSEPDGSVPSTPSGKQFRLLVPTDFSSAAEAALRTAVRIARRTGGSITLFHVVEVTLGDTATGPAPNERQWVETWSQKSLKLRETAASLTSGGLVALPLVVEGLPAEQILAAAVHHDLVVLGKPKASRRWRWFAKRTLRTVVEVCSRAVVVVPG